jgi:hypothetical protein
MILKNVQSATRLEQVNAGAFVVLYQALRVPPHILLCFDGRLYSLSIAGRFPKQSLEALWRNAIIKNVPLVFFEWKLPTSVENAEDLAADILNKYNRVIPYETTCLDPIRETIGTLHNDDQIRKAPFIFTMLNHMFHSGMVGNVLELNCSMNKGTLHLPEYQAEDVANAALKAIESFKQRQKV